MAERSQPHQQVQVQATPAYRYEGSVKASDQNGPSTSQVLAILAGVPIGGTLLLLAGLFLIGSLIGLALATPIFVLFSPVLVPAAFTIGLAVAGISTSGTCGLTGLMSFSWVANCIRQKQGLSSATVPEQLESAKRRVADMVSYGGQKTKDVGNEVQSKAQEAKRT